MEHTTFRSINPATLEEVASYPSISQAQLDNKLVAAEAGYTAWRSTSIANRLQCIASLAEILRNNVETYAHMITLEMGKPITESRAEVLKCATCCDYYVKHAQAILALEHVEVEASKCYVRHDPLGAVLAIMPWNFPFWQVIRCAVPALTAGNVVLLKHAPNVIGCARQILSAMHQAGIPESVMQSIEIHHADVEQVIAHPLVQAVSLTGSERAGKSVAALAGKYLKKCVLELGGSNAFVVWDDANVAWAAEVAVGARMGNSGQSCIAAKRFIVHAKVYDAFVTEFTKRVDALVVDNPLAETTQVGPLARVDLAEQLEEQLTSSVSKGATVIAGGVRRDAWFSPTVVTNVVPGMRIFDEETFGPLACITRADSNHHGIDLATTTVYGLGISVFTADTNRAELVATTIPDGYVAINAAVKSDARLPFGGTKRSGYGRELSRDGLLEFVNRKTVIIQEEST